MELYGSSINGFGTKSSDINIDVVLGEKDHPAQTLINICQILKDCSEYKNIIIVFL